MLEASLDVGEDPAAAAKALQQQAEGLVEDHKQSLLTSIEELYQLTQHQAEVMGLQRQLVQAQERLDQVRKEYPQLSLPESSAAAGNEHLGKL
jgi:outer membrane protein TolC